MCLRWRRVIAFEGQMSDVFEGHAVSEVRKRDVVNDCRLTASVCTLFVGTSAPLHVLKPSVSCAHTLAVPSFV